MLSKDQYKILSILHQYLFLSSKNLNLFKFTIDTYLRDKNKMKNHFLMQGETRPCFIHKTVFLYLFDHICSNNVGIYNVLKRILIEMLWLDDYYQKNDV